MRRREREEEQSPTPPPFPPPPTTPTTTTTHLQLQLQQQQQQQLPFNQFYLEQPGNQLYSQLESENLIPISSPQHPIKKRAFSGSVEGSTQHVRQKSSMGEEQQITSSSRRSGVRKAGLGEIVEVQGGHIVRATGRKDRHSKVCTAKGPRDRRVRLSAHTAIQFYDVQDRLGYDRPSKAVDWLINKAKNAIDELEQLPAWSPTTMDMDVLTSTRRRGKTAAAAAEGKGGGSAEGMYGSEQQQQQQQQQQYYDSNVNSSGSGLLPPSLDSDAIADTIKSFFPMGGGGHNQTTSASVSPMQFQDYSHGGLLQRSGCGGGSSNSSRQSQDLKLSLQSFQDPILMHTHSQHHHAAHHEHQHTLFPGAVPIGFENPNTGWTDGQHQPNPELGRLHRLMLGWNTQHAAADVGTSSGGGSGGGGFIFNQPSPLLHPLFGSGQHSQYFTERGPLQSNNTSSIRAWISDPSFSIASSNEQHSHHHHPHQAIAVHPQAFQGLGFTSGGFSGFSIPARIQGEEERDGDPNRPSSASSGSHH